MTIGAPQTNDIRRAVELLRQAPPEGRTLTDLGANLQSAEMRSALEPYTMSGVMGQLLDADRDTLADRNFMTFEIEELLALSPKYAIPVLLYLFHVLERRLTGQPALLVLDEAWIMLGHPVFREKVREWLKVLRKVNCAVVLATQSLDDAVNSGIISVLIESCPTKILLPNEEARNEIVRPVYEQFGLNGRQIELIAQAAYKRHYYVMSPEGRRLIDLQLGPVALSFVGASGKEDLAAIRQLEAEYGDEWTWEWLRQRGIPIDDPTTARQFYTDESRTELVPA